jgi:predicted metal-dependent phosphoesterase TrpH
MHTTASDGTLSPRKLVKRAVKRGVRVIAVSDHDTTAGLAEAYDEAKNYDITIIPAIEINCDFRGTEAHILGYFIDIENQTMQTTLERIRMHRTHRTAMIVRKLREEGALITEEEVNSYSKGESIGRPHIAQALVAKGYAHDVSDAFDKWLGRGKPGYLPRESLTPTQAIDLIKGANGIPVLAHPIYVGSDEFIEEFITAGLAGLEVRYPQHSALQQQHFADLARRHNLAITGGSDFHGPKVSKNVEIGDVDFNLSDLRRFCEHVGRECPEVALKATKATSRA